MRVSRRGLGSLREEYVRCGKPTCACARGDRHGPYLYEYFWERDSGRPGGRRLRKRYVPIAAVNARLEAWRKLIEAAAHMAQAAKAIPRVSAGVRELEDADLAWLGQYRHGRRLRSRRSLPDEERDRRRYARVRVRIWQAVGRPVTEQEYLDLRRQVRAAQKRCNRLRLPWPGVDPQTGLPLTPWRHEPGSA